MKLVMHTTDLEWIPAHNNSLYNHAMVFDVIVWEEGVNMKLVMHITELDWIPAHTNSLHNHALAFDVIVWEEGVNISYPYN